MSYLSIAALQLELPLEDNLSLLENEIDLLHKRFPWVQMVVLPELAVFGSNTELAVALPGEVENCFREAARRNGIWLIPGSLFERDGDRIYNTAPVINPNGEVVTRCRKLYPFLPYEQGVASGTEFTVFDVPGVGRVGLCICYDMWFPEVSRTLTWLGAEVILCPSLTNTVDRNLEVSIAQANAAMHQVYFLNNNSAGRMAVGQTALAGPDGKLIHRAGTGREIIAHELDLGHVRRVRERGLMGLGQVLKSYRDHPLDFPPYRDPAGEAGAFAGLGELKVPDAES